MISLQTELKLAHLLKTIADSEKQVEIVRQVLAEQRDFEPYTAFKRIDELGLGYIRVADLHKFLKENGVPATENDILYIFSLFDSNGDQPLTYSNFLKAILPVTNPTLRQRATQRESYHVGKNEILPYDIEWSLARVFDKELIAYRKIELLKEELFASYDFDLRDAFKTVDYDRLGLLDHESLYQFFQRNRIGASDDDILALLRRIDKDQDNRVSYAEFIDAINLVDQIEKLETQSPKRTSHRSVERTPSRTLSRMSPRSKRKSPPRSKALETSTLTQSTQKLKSSRDFEYHSYLSKTKTHSPRRTEVLSKSVATYDNNKRPDPVRESISRNFLKELEEERLNKSLTNWSPNKSRISAPADGYRTPSRNRLSSPTRRSPSRERSSPLKGSEEEHFARTLRNQIELDQDIENLRNELTLKSDFNLLDAFKIFDLSGKGYITTAEFEDGLREFNVYPSRDELYLIVKKFDKDGDGLLKYSEFAEIFAPKNIDYAGILTSKTPSYMNSRKAHLLFGYDTRKDIQKFFEILFENEGITENMRQKLNRRPLFDVYDAFRALDKNKNGFITLDEFKEVLRDHRIYASQNEVKMLLKRFDKDQDGKVSYREFLSEITPKLSSKLY